MIRYRSEKKRIAFHQYYYPWGWGSPSEAYETLVEMLFYQALGVINPHMPFLEKRALALSNKNKTLAMEEVHKNIFWIEFASRRDLSSTFLRFQEYYESPEFVGKTFTLEEFKKWYSPDEEFTYYDDWDGFNIPSWVLEPFINGKFHPLSEEETCFINTFKHKEGDFYIIGTHGRDADALEHEIAHGLFFTEKEYKKKALKILDECLQLETLKKIKDVLAVDYAETSLVDEVHAYLLDSLEWLEDKGLTGEDIDFASSKIKDLFRSYYKKS